MPNAYINADGEWVKECVVCGQIKPATDEHFALDLRKGDGFDGRCRTCFNLQIRAALAEVRKRGAMIKHQAFVLLGGKCSEPGCHMRYPEDHPGNFDLDHIDPSLKQHFKETQTEWIARNEHEFMTRVVPNLQVLCVHHHRARTSQQKLFGGELHILRYGTAVREDFPVDPYADNPTLFE